MHASLRGNRFKSGLFASLAGVVLSLTWLATAFAAEAEAAEPLNWTDFAYRVVATSIVVAVLVKLLKKPMANFLSARREEIKSLLSELETRTAEAKAEHARVQAKMDSLEEETKKIVDELISEGEAERQKIIEAAHREADYIQQQAHVAIEQEMQTARGKLKDEVADLAVAGAEAIIQKKIRAEDQQRLVNEFMTKVVEAK
ncbi:MAG: F0F1 ATP synthase subunit B [Syntrophobacteraceae bacterium]|nr:F0F1 ATP synthase subunit B [Syntrophobacteraceae bacterium]